MKKTNLWFLSCDFQEPTSTRQRIRHQNLKSCGGMVFLRQVPEAQEL